MQVSRDLDHPSLGPRLGLVLLLVALVFFSLIGFLIRSATPPTGPNIERIVLTALPSLTPEDYDHNSSNSNSNSDSDDIYTLAGDVASSLLTTATTVSGPISDLARFLASASLSPETTTAATSASNPSSSSTSWQQHAVAAFTRTNASAELDLLPPELCPTCYSAAAFHRSIQPICALPAPQRSAGLSSDHPILWHTNQGTYRAPAAWSTAASVITAGVRTGKPLCRHCLGAARCQSAASAAVHSALLPPAVARHERDYLPFSPASAANNYLMNSNSHTAAAAGLTANSGDDVNGNSGEGASNNAASSFPQQPTLLNGWRSIDGSRFDIDSCVDAIDVVYTWVNGSAPSVRASRVAARRGLGRYVSPVFASLFPPPAPDQNSLGDNRFRDSGELQYSMRSILKHAPWVRRIFLVTSGETPSWLNTSHPSVTVVPHSVIFKDAKRNAPSFSSSAIESALHRIPGLSDNYIYVNDDVFFIKPVEQEAFWSPASGLLLERAGWQLQTCNVGCETQHVGDGVCHPACMTEACQWDLGDCERNYLRAPAPWEVYDMLLALGPSGQPPQGS